MYAELAGGGWIERISANAGVSRAGPADPGGDATDAAASAPSKASIEMPSAAGAAALPNASGSMPAAKAAAPTEAGSTP